MAENDNKVVSSDSYHEYVPAITTLHKTTDYWKGLGINVYAFSGENEGIIAPGVAEYGINFITSSGGIGNCCLSNRKWKKKELQPGSGIILQPYESIGWQWHENAIDNGEAESVHLFLSANLINDVRAQVTGTDSNSNNSFMDSQVGIGDNFMYQLTLELRDAANQNNPFGKLFGETAAQLLAVYLLRKYATIHPKLPVYRGGLQKKTLQTVTDYIHDHLNRDISLESLSILTGLSSYHFARQFKQSTGLAPHQYVVQCRIDKAKELLKHTNLSITQIALEIGYESQSHFTGLFKRLVGVTPKIYREQI